MTPLNALDAAIKIAGTQRKLAEGIGRKHQSYIGEIRRRLVTKEGGAVPAHVCPAIEKFTKGKVKRHHLNPKVAW
jgi:DNA-binding transcriptional regulator YdaS (Cro superfamily)